MSLCSQAVLLVRTQGKLTWLAVLALTVALCGAQPALARSGYHPQSDDDAFSSARSSRSRYYSDRDFNRQSIDSYDFHGGRRAPAPSGRNSYDNDQVGDRYDSYHGNRYDSYHDSQYDNRYHNHADDRDFDRYDSRYDDRDNDRYGPPIGRYEDRDDSFGVLPGLQPLIDRPSGNYNRAPSPQAPPQYQQSPRYQPPARQPPVYQAPPHTNTRQEMLGPQNLTPAEIQQLISRRYQDAAVIHLINSIPADRGLAMYAEVLELIATRHLSPPAPQILVQNGVTDLIYALQTPAFVQTVQLRANAQQLGQFQQSLTAMLQQTPVRNNNDAVSIAQWVTQSAYQQLGLSPTITAIELIYGAAQSLDKFSAFVPPETAQASNRQLGQAAVGGGVPLQTRTVSHVRMLDPATGVGYVKLDLFAAGSAAEMEQALSQLSQQRMQSLVLDLRGNPGGLLETAIQLADMFLPQGTIVSTRGRNTTDNTQEVARPERTWSMPLIVLIDHGSASASEIFAAAIQENRRGLIVGQHSYGKGTVQSLFTLKSSAAMLRLTTAEFYSPSGREMAGAGVEPDVPVTAGQAGGQDAELVAAVDVARRQSMGNQPAYGNVGLYGGR